MDCDGDEVQVTVDVGTVWMYVRDDAAPIVLTPSRARALAAILNSAADMAGGGKQ